MPSPFFGSAWLLSTLKGRDRCVTYSSSFQERKESHKRQLPLCPLSEVQVKEGGWLLGTVLGSPKMSLSWLFFQSDVHIMPGWSISDKIYSSQALLRCVRNAGCYRICPASKISVKVLNSQMICLTHGATSSIHVFHKIYSR